MFILVYNLCEGADVDGNEVMKGQIDKDGLPYIGRYMTFGEPYYRYYYDCDTKIPINTKSDLELYFPLPPHVLFCLLYFFSLVK